MMPAHRMDMMIASNDAGRRVPPAHEIISMLRKHYDAVEIVFYSRPGEDNHGATWQFLQVVVHGSCADVAEFLRERFGPSFEVVVYKCFEQEKHPLVTTSFRVYLKVVGETPLSLSQQKEIAWSHWFRVKELVKNAFDYAGSPRVFINSSIRKFKSREPMFVKVSVTHDSDPESVAKAKEWIDFFDQHKDDTVMESDMRLDNDFQLELSMKKPRKRNTQRKRY